MSSETLRILREFRINQKDFNILYVTDPEQYLSYSYKQWEKSNRMNLSYEAREYAWHLYCICRDKLFKKIYTDHIQIPN